MPVTTRSQTKMMTQSNGKSDISNSSKCSTNKNGSPPCADGFTMKLNKKKEHCCYKEPKKRTLKVHTVTETDVIKNIVNQHDSIMDLLKNKLSQRVVDEARLSHLVENKEELYKQGESDVKKFFSKWLKGGDTLARYFLHDEGMRLYKRVEKLNFMIAPSKQHKYMLDHLKYKYKHLRHGKMSYLRKEEKELANKFWETFANEPLAKKNIKKFNIFKTAIQDGIDQYFYLRKKVYELEPEEHIDDYNEYN